MKNKFHILIMLVIVILVVALICKFNKISKGYDMSKTGKDMPVKGQLAGDDECNFHTFVQLGNEEPLSSSILELKMNARIEQDKNTGKHVLKNAKLQVNPIGCQQYDKQPELVDEKGYSANCQFGVKPGQSLNQRMDVGCAKLLAKSGNVRINSVASVDSHTRINSIHSLKRAKDNSRKVEVDYTVLNQYYSQWFNIRFTPTSCNEGVFRVE